MVANGNHAIPARGTGSGSPVMGPKRSPAQSHLRGRLRRACATIEAPSRDAHRQRSGYLDPGSFVMACSRSEYKGSPRPRAVDGRTCTGPVERRIGVDGGLPTPLQNTAGRSSGPRCVTRTPADITPAPSSRSTRPSAGDDSTGILTDPCGRSDIGYSVGPSRTARNRVAKSPEKHGLRTMRTIWTMVLGLYRVRRHCDVGRGMRAIREMVLPAIVQP